MNLIFSSHGMIMRKMACFFLVCLLSVFFSPVVQARQESFPGEDDSAEEEPWFRGWYTRITDEYNNRSMAVIGASQYLPSESSDEDIYWPGYLAVIISEMGQTKIYEAFPNRTTYTSHREPTAENWDITQWSEFRWHAQGYGTITNDMIDIEIPEVVKVTAFLGDQIPWNRWVPWLGPEGMIEFLPSLPTYWFVYTLGSETVYEYTLFSEGAGSSRKGGGYAHQESNWGNVFPLGWIWAQGIDHQNEAQIALAGAEVRLGNRVLASWLIGYRSPRLQWDFRPTFPGTVFVSSVTPCSGNFFLTAKDSMRKLVISATVPMDSFVVVSAATEEGFKPGGVESFSATIKVEAYLQTPVSGELQVEQRIFENAAIEFGARYMCSQ